MPKIIELTVEIDIQKVSCPGVWLCQGGRVCLTVFALGTSYQTCLLPPVFPLMFKDVFYFKKRFQESCALNNICCLLKDETIYCELVQCGTKCATEECMVLAQYLGAMNDVLFPPNMCSNDGVDLLMRRSKIFPGILSPKIEIATKVRIDEVWDQPLCQLDPDAKVDECHCAIKTKGPRQKQVCHTAGYHRVRCNPRNASASRSSSCSRSRSAGSSSLNSIKQKTDHCSCTKPIPPCPPPRPLSCASHPPLCRNYCGYTMQSSDRERSRWPRDEKYDDLSDDNVISSERHADPKRRSGLRQLRDYYVYNVQTPSPLQGKSGYKEYDAHSDDLTRFTDGVFDTTEQSPMRSTNEDQSKKVILESRYIEQDNCKKSTKYNPKIYFRAKTAPCVCEICRRYHELFHSNQS